MTARFSVITPMYNVAPYLADYFASLVDQDYPFAQLDVILVDDGSTDDTLRLAREFADRFPANVRVVTKVNGGQASARNVGLDLAHGEWVTFPDPDDVLGATYFADVEALIASAEHDDVAMYTARMLMWHEGEPRRRSVVDSHSLSERFAEGTRYVDLVEEPEIIQAHVTTGFLRRERIEAASLRFRETLRLRFEDGNFVTRYLLGFPRPIIGIVASSTYLYRQRADDSSTVQSSAKDPRKYTDTIRYGYLDVVEAAEGSPPRWAQNLMVYDLLWIFRASQSPKLQRVPFPEDMHTQLQELIPRFMQHIDDDVVREFTAMRVSDWMKDALLLMKRGGGHGDVYFGAVDPLRGLVSMSYRYLGDRPTERLQTADAVIEARFSKDWGLELLGRRVVWQRTLWIDADAGVALALNGVDQDVLVRAAKAALPRVATTTVRTAVREARVRAQPAAATVSGLARLKRRGGITMRELRAVLRERPGVGEAFGRVARAWSVMAPKYARRFEAAWVFMDRDVDANDSGEILYKWVAREHPEINSYFVLRKDSPDWARLRAEGVRLVAYGSTAFAGLMLAAEHVASSHADRFVTDPIPKRYGRRAWNFTFLQHGVIKGDISRWLNPKEIATMVVSTEDEYAYITEPSPFRVGRKEVRLTGLPRFDAMLAQDAAVTPLQRDIVLVMPTWRDYLVSGMADSSRERSGVEDFSSTTYARSIAAFFASAELGRIARGNGVRIVLMPHPNMRVFLDRFDIPDFVEVVSYDDVDVRDMIARARVLVTDYSSVAFNMAYVQRPIVYFQFDREEYYTSHTERPGYFDYETHGFGPVTTTAADAITALGAALDGSLDDVYAQRMAATFPVRDGQNCRRVYEAMLESRRAAPAGERRVAAPPETWDGWLAGQS